MKGLTRREVQQWFAPIRECLRQMHSGEVDCIQGHPVTLVGGEYGRVDYAMLGWIGCISRMLPDADLNSMRSLYKRISNGVPVTVAEIEACQRLLNLLERPMMRLSREVIKKAVLDEQIQIEVDRIGLTGGDA